MEKQKRKPGAGRKPKYIEKTKTIAFRVPISFIETLRNYVRNSLKKYEKEDLNKKIDKAIEEMPFVETLKDVIES